MESLFIDLVKEKGIIKIINHYKIIFETFEKKKTLNKQFKNTFNYLYLSPRHSLIISNDKIRYYYFCNCCHDKDVYIHSLDVKTKELIKYDICLHNCRDGHQKVDIVSNRFAPFHNYLDNPVFIDVLEFHMELLERGIEDELIIRLLKEKIYEYL